jgi:hypothetical protein
MCVFIGAWVIQYAISTIQFIEWQNYTKRWHVGLKGISGNHCLFKNTIQAFIRTGRNHETLRDGQQPNEYYNLGSSKIQVSCTDVYINLLGCAHVRACVHAPVLLRDALCTVSIQSLATVLTFSFSQSFVPTCSTQQLISLPYSISNIHVSHLEIHVSIITKPYSRRWPFLPLTIRNQAKHHHQQKKKVWT